jgi:hydroxymethylpyrimidine/phosphomethylpyrimidine kinase
MKTVLTIAGFDPSSGAGITADLAVFTAHGLFGTSAITAMTVQSTLGVESVHPADGRILTRTLEWLDRDLPAAGVKLGMIGSSSVAKAVVAFLTILRQRIFNPFVVLDPVLSSSSGRELLSPEGLSIVRERLLPLVDWITPNIVELSLLSGLPVSSHDQLTPAAQAIQRTYPGLGVFATGGHLDPPNDLLLTAEGESIWLPGEHIASTSTHGTGCALSSAFLSRLVLGDPVNAAASKAKAYVAQAIRTAPVIGHGAGPLNLMWPLQASC